MSKYIKTVYMHAQKNYCRYWRVIILLKKKISSSSSFLKSWIIKHKLLGNLFSTYVRKDSSIYFSFIDFISIIYFQRYLSLRTLMLKNSNSFKSSHSNKNEIFFNTVYFISLNHFLKVLHWYRIHWQIHSLPEYSISCHIQFLISLNEQ